MRIVARSENRDIAAVTIAELDNGNLIEFVESVQPPIPRYKKWVLIVSTMVGCPISCPICDAGDDYRGKLSTADILAQIDYLVRSRFPDGRVPVEKFKIQFARMGDPALNGAVLDVLQELPEIYDAPGLMPTISTVAPASCDAFFTNLLEIKNRIYRERFLLQFSIHTTDQRLRDWMIPVKKWSLDAIADYGKAFYRDGERKITLNFALADGMPVDPDVLLSHFPTEMFLIKITPVNPTYQARKNGIRSLVTPEKETHAIIDTLKNAGYQVILSIGEWEENHIGSNCGQAIIHYRRKQDPIKEGYTYPLETVSDTVDIGGMDLKEVMHDGK